MFNPTQFSQVRGSRLDCARAAQAFQVPVRVCEAILHGVLSLDEMLAAADATSLIALANERNRAHNARALHPAV